MQIRGSTQIIAGTVPLTALVSGYSIPSANLVDGANFLKKDGSVAMTAAFNAGGFVISSVALPVAATDAATKAYVDQKNGGIGGIHDVRILASANVNTATSALTAIDGVTPVAGDLILCIAQTTASQNGPWVASASAWTRPSWWASATTVNEGQYFMVAEGTAYKDTKFWCTNVGTITVDTTSTTFSQDNGSIYTAGTGLGLAGGQFSVTYGTTSGTSAQGNDTRITGALQTTALGTGVQTALGVAAGTAGAFVVNGGALGTPATGTLTNCAGLPLAGVTGFGTGVATALAINTGSNGAVALFNGALGTPSSVTLTNATGLPIAGLTGLGTGVAAALALATNAAGGVPTLAAGGALAAANFPALTGDVTTVAGSLATTINHTSGVGFVKYTDYIWNETPAGTVNGSNVTFTLANAPANSGAAITIEQNGLTLQPGGGNDYTISGAVITFVAAPQTGDLIRAYYLK